jgi:hypothetical protein
MCTVCVRFTLLARGASTSSPKSLDKSTLWRNDGSATFRFFVRVLPFGKASTRLRGGAALSLSEAVVEEN